jgi:Flp pilus assembly pilin Flp
MRNRWLSLWLKLNLNAETVYRLIEDRRGVTAVEYALIAALIAVAAIAAPQQL